MHGGQTTESMRILFSTFAIGLIALAAHAQEEADRDWNGFSQTVDVVNYRGGKFRLKAFVRAENADKESHARLWARINNTKGVGFFDNMVKRPIIISEWKEYIIEGEIGPTAQSLVVGGLYFGFGKYYYDNFTLEIQKEDSAWEPMPLTNGDFESNVLYEGWKLLYVIKGFESTLTTAEGLKGTQSLVIDGFKRSTLSFGSNREKGKVLEANGIRMYYEEYGTGEPLLLLHGNAESISSFKYQIPELSKTFRVIALDSRGQGRSTENGEKLSYELMAEDVNAFLNETGLTNVNVLGWSDGGTTGLILAMKHPEKVKRLATMGANLYNDKTSVDDKINEQFRSLREKIVKQDRPESKFEVQLIDLALNEPKINSEELKAIRCPTLVMAGSKDVIKEAHTKLIAAKIEKSKLVIFDKGTHYEPQENPERFNRTVLEFFNNK